MIFANTLVNVFRLQGEFSQKISPSCSPSSPRLASSPSFCPCTTSRASSSWAWRWAVVPSSCTRTRMVNPPRRTTPCSAPSTWLTASKWLGASRESRWRSDVGGCFLFWAPDFSVKLRNLFLWWTEKQSLGCFTLLGEKKSPKRQEMCNWTVHSIPYRKAGSRF